MEPLQSYTVPLLRNFQIQELTPVLKQCITGYNKKIQETTGENGWQKISTLLDAEKSNGWDDVSFDKFLFNQLTFTLPDHVYLCHLKTTFTADSFINKYNKTPFFNRKLASTIHSKEKIISIRKFNNQVVFLYKAGVSLLGKTEQRSLFLVPCVLDFENGFLLIKIRKHYLSRNNNNINSLINEICTYLNSMLDEDLQIQRFTKTSIHNILYKIFSDESSKAEKIIKDNTPKLTESEINSKILGFLGKELKLSDPQNYLDRVKSAFYQDASLQIEDSLFYKGFIFGFTFFDKNLIKSATKNPSREPVYNSKVYWNLKDLIHEYEEVTELSLFWKFHKTNFTLTPPGNNFGFVEITISEKYGSFELHFYKGLGNEGSLRENYVIYKIKEYL